MDVELGLENLTLAGDALTSLKIPYFLTDGTLLGFVRNGHFIEWDNDIDIGVFAEDFNICSFWRYASIMRRHGFTYRFYGVWGKNFVAHWRRNNVLVDVSFYFRQGNQRIVNMFTTHHIIELSYPARLIESLQPVTFYGKTVMAPKYDEAVLSHQYGDWKIPRTDWDWRTSPLNITHRTRITRWKMLQERVSNGIMRIAVRILRQFSLPR